MEYVYAALLVHNAGGEVTEDKINAVLNAADVSVDETRVKALVSALEGIDIDDALSKAAVIPQAAPVGAVASAEEVTKEEKEEEAKEEEEESAEESGMEGLGALFG
ncbi:MAG: 50S ribosomal protein L12 [Candidatus Syntrophoarchaeum sp. GoM_oil]|nr:MAG: 50S ribosomal protein L12 [Candidatus Syntrophoarchaeum sp. GoM_oil]